MSSLSTSDSAILPRFGVLLSHTSTNASSGSPSHCAITPEARSEGPVAVEAANNERPSLLLDALGNESLIFEDEEREFLESPIVSTFPIPIVPTPRDEQEFYQCTSDASFCSIDEDPSAFLDAPPAPHPYEVDFTPDAHGTIIPSHTLFLDFPGVMLHAPNEGDVDQPVRPFVDEDNCFIRELPDPELLAPPATTFGGEVLSGDDYIVVPEGFTIEAVADDKNELEGCARSGESVAGRQEQNRDARESFPLPRSISNKENTCTASHTSLRALDDPEPGLSETLSTLIKSTSDWSIITRAQEARNTSLFYAPEPQGIVLVPSKIISSDDTRPLRASESTDADICYTGVVPSLVLHVAESEDWDAQDHCLPPITSYDYELHYPFQALMEEAQRQESCVQDMWHELTETVAKAWRVGGMGGSEPPTVLEQCVDEAWKVGKRKESEGKEVMVWQEKGLTSWFARKFETGKRKWKNF